MCGDTKLKEANAFFENLINGISGSINVSLLARVERINLSNMVADIKPLKKDLPLIQNAPVAMSKVGDYFIRSNIKAGDIVLVLFSDYALDGFIDDGKERDVVIDDRHSLNNAVIVGAVATMNTSPGNIKDFEEVVEEIVKPWLGGGI